MEQFYTGYKHMSYFIENIIFDLDGTLIDSMEDIVICLKKAFNIYGINNININKSDIGPPLIEMIKNIASELDEEQIKEIVKNFRIYYDNHDYSKTILHNGVRKLLITLKKLNIKLFLATNKPVLPTNKIMKKLNIDYFSDIITHDIIEGKKLSKTEMILHLIKKWNMNRDKTIMVGDSENDIIAAHENSIISIAVLNGYGHIDTIDKHKPSYKVDNIKHILTIINQINQVKE